MTTLLLRYMGELGEVTVDPATGEVASASALLQRVVAHRLARARRFGTPLTPTGPTWTHAVDPWTDERELAIALADMLDESDPWWRQLAADAELAALVSVPDGAVA